VPRVKAKDVRAGMEGITLEVKVISVGEPEEVKTRFGTAARAVATVEDETGRVALKLWRGQVDLVRPGDTILIENGFVAEFGGRVEVNVGSKGRIVVLKRGR
jgi:replication factor A1